MPNPSPNSRRRRPGQKPVDQEPRYFSDQVSEARRFFLDLNPKSGRGLKVASGGCEYCRPDYEIKRSDFGFPIIEFVAGGLGRLTLRKQEYALMPGTVFVYGPNMPHCIRSDPHNPLVKYFVAFTGQAGRQLLEECQLGLCRVVRVTHPEQIQQVFDDLIRHGRSDHPDRARMCTVALQYLIMKIGDVASPYGETAGRAFATYQRCRRYIEEHYAEVHGLHEVASACHVDLSYLCRLFQRFGREKPFKYLQHLRLNRAADLLQNSGRLVKEVADELGFSDPYNFSRAFQRAFGLPPGRVGQAARGRRSAG